jgi:hypothetical protein
VTRAHGAAGASDALDTTMRIRTTYTDAVWLGVILISINLSYVALKLVIDAMP